MANIILTISDEQTEILIQMAREEFPNDVALNPTAIMQFTLDTTCDNRRRDKVMKELQSFTMLEISEALTYIKEGK